MRIFIEQYVLIGLVLYFLSVISWCLFNDNKRNLKVIDLIGGIIVGLIFWPFAVIILQQELWSDRNKRIKNDRI